MITLVTGNFSTVRWISSCTTVWLKETGAATIVVHRPNTPPERIFSLGGRIHTITFTLGTTLTVITRDGGVNEVPLKCGYSYSVVKRVEN